MTKQEYKKALDWLFVQMPNYQNNGQKAYKPGLENIRRLCDFFDNPQDSLKMIHVGGTNGKGSVTSMVASVLQEQGYKVGLYTSPHLIEFTERIRVNGKNADQEFVYRFIQKLKSNLPSEIRPSFFEFTTVMAFEYFKEQKVDYAVIEVGLGGRLDSTNIIHPIVCAITNVGLDHMEILGDTVEKIAVEKAGIVKPGIPVVEGSDIDSVKSIIEDKAKRMNAKYINALNIETVLSSDLKGLYQKNNIKVAQALVQELRILGIAISDKSLEAGLLHVQQNTGLIGRWTKVSEHPLTICDTGHNEDGWKFVIEQLNGLKQRKHVVLGFVKEKKIDHILETLPVSEKYYFVTPPVARGRDPHDYEAELKARRLNYRIFKEVQEALEAARNDCQDNEMIFVGGSNFIVGKFLEKSLHE